jgi:glycosyltransferase involved in cell wall biosynthesis
MKISLVTATLGGGGAERALLVLAEEFARRDHEVTIVTWSGEEPDSYAVPMGVERVRAGLSERNASVRWHDVIGNISRVLGIRRAVQKTQPDVVISFQDGTNELFLISSIGEGYKKLVSCQNDLTRHPHYNPRWETLRRYVYRLADRIVFLDRTQAEHAERHFAGWKCDGIPNPVPEIDVTPDAEAGEVLEKLSRFPIRLVAMGRLAHQKGFDLLLDAFKIVRREFPEAGLVILGEGHLRAELEEQRSRLGLEEGVLMPGRLSKPHAVIAQCDVFIFSSRYEGQGLALVEAMACGVPAVSFDCPSGPGLIINNNVDGLLVPPEDVRALSSAVIKLLSDESKREALRLAAKNVRERYSATKVCSMWESLFAA